MKKTNKYHKIISQNINKDTLQTSCSRRSLLLWGLQFFGLISLASRFAYLQLFKHNYFRSVAENNHIKIRVLPGIRGSILALDDKVIIGNKFLYRVTLNDQYKKDIAEIVREFDQTLGIVSDISSVGIKRAILQYRRGYSSIIIHDKLTIDDLAKISENMNLTNKIVIEQVLVRSYPYHQLLCHITGYTAKLSPEEKAKQKSGYVPNIDVGKNGIEKFYDNELQGQHTLHKVEVNVMGGVVRNLEKVVGAPGIDIKTSIDIGLQEKIRDIMEDKRGSVVILDPKNGGVIAMYSTPCYDPNHFSRGISKAEWHDLINNREKPMINKAVGAIYPPGSVFKLATALAILNAGIDPREKVFCNGSYQLGNHTFHCWREYGHGAVNLEEAIAGSCSVYFYTLGRRAGIDNIEKAGDVFGLGQKTMVDLPFESSGIIPSKKWKMQRLKSSWTTGDTINTTIGQGYVLTTPIQLALFMARIASGLRLQPSVCVEKARNAIYEKLGVKDEYLNLLRNGLYGVFNKPFGTGYNQRIDINDMQLVGKTGTAQVVSIRKTQNKKLLEHGVFAGYFPYKDPKYAISVIIENGGWGSKSALPVARKILLSTIEIPDAGKYDKTEEDIMLENSDLNQKQNPD